jgi:hypothetical protein
VALVLYVSVLQFFQYSGVDSFSSIVNLQKHKLTQTKLNVNILFKETVFWQPKEVQLESLFITYTGSVWAKSNNEYKTAEM